MLKNLFDSENVVMRALGKLFDLMVLNLLFILCCIPVVTIGASVTALYTVMLKMVEHNEGYIVRNFFKAFKSNFKQSTIIWVILLAIGGIIAVDWYFANKLALSFAEILNYAFAFFGVCYVMVLSYVFPIQSKFENKVFATILNAFMMSVAHFLPWTLLIVALNIAPFLLLLVDTEVLFYVVIPVLIMVGFSLVAFFISKIFNHIFGKHILEVKDNSSMESKEE